MSNMTLVKELFTTSMLLQDTLAAVRRKESEMDALRSAHEEELKVQNNEIDSLKTQILLMQMLVQGTMPQPTAEPKVESDEYTV